MDPAQFGWDTHSLEGLRGGAPAENAAVIVAVLGGRDRRTARAATMLNAGAAIFVAGRAGSIAEGLNLAAEALDSGAAAAKLEALRQATRNAQARN